MTDANQSEIHKTEQLIHRANAGDSTAFDELILHVSARLCAIAHKTLARNPQVRRWEETDDVMQAALLRLHRSLAEVQPDTVAGFFGLATTQVRRIVIDLTRHYYGVYGVGAKHKSDAHANAADDSAGQLENASCLDRPDSLEDWTAFHQAIQQLLAPEKEVFSLMWYSGLTQRQIAEILGISERTVIRRMNRARLQLHQLIADQQASL